MNVPELKELEGKIADRQNVLAGIFAEAGPDLDVTKVKSLGDSADVVAKIRELNDELTDLGKKASDLRIVSGIAQANRDAMAGRPAGESGDGATSGTGSEPTSRKSVGELFTDAKANTTKGREIVLDYDPIAELKTVLSTSAGWAPQAIRNDRMISFATRPIELLDFIPTVPTDQIAVVYMEETTFTNNAAETAEAGQKPEAALALTERSLTIRKIAVTIPVTDEQLEDVPRIQAYLNNRLPFMVRQRLAGQIVSGDGSAPNVRGILNTSGIQTQAVSTDPVPDAIYKAMTKVRVTGLAEPDAYVTNPTDWQDVRLLRTADGIYIWGSPSAADPESIWGLKVIQAQAMTLNTGVVGAWQMFSELDVKKGLVVETGYVNDDFVKNKQTIRAEMRCVPVFYRPSAFCQVTGV